MEHGKPAQFKEFLPVPLGGVENGNARSRAGADSSSRDCDFGIYDRDAKARNDGSWRWVGSEEGQGLGGTETPQGGGTGDIWGAWSQLQRGRGCGLRRRMGGGTEETAGAV